MLRPDRRLSTTVVILGSLAGAVAMGWGIAEGFAGPGIAGGIAIVVGALLLSLFIGLIEKILYEVTFIRSRL